MIINSNNQSARRPNNIEPKNNVIELVCEFKLLWCLLDDKLNFKKYFCNLISKTKVCRNLFAIKIIFFLANDNKINFLNTFLLPHFDYFASLFIYFSDTLINKINKLYNLCLFVLRAKQHFVQRSAIYTKVA